MTQIQTVEMLLGALVADAACLGTHWIYEPERIAEIADRNGGEAAFAPVEAANYDGVKGFFAHGARAKGALTQNGEVLRLTINTMIAQDGAFDASAYQSAFAAHFGAGGAYCGYIDGPTRAALANIAAERGPSGSDDDQTPALARLPAILAVYQNDATLSDAVNASLQVTHVNATATAYSDVFCAVLAAVLADTPLEDALEAAALAATGPEKAALLEALNSPEPDSSVFAGLTGIMGRACGLASAGPVMFHILKRSGSYREAIERNVLAGGDSAGRALLIGAIMGRVHGTTGAQGLPMSWALNLADGAAIWDECERLAAF